MPTNLIILAAGAGTRMQSDRPKVMHEIAGLPLYAHAIASGASIEPEKIVLIVGAGAEEVGQDARARFDNIEIVEQKEQLGTGHAALQAQSALTGAEGDAVVLFGDTPFVRAETLAKMKDARNTADIVILGFTPVDPARYGRLVTQGDELLKIVEYKDASPDIRDITLCNSGVVMADAATLFSLLEKVEPSAASGEYYLTDIVEIGREQGLVSRVVTCGEEETLGVNTRQQLSDAEDIFQKSARREAIENGVTLLASDTVFFSHDTHLGRDAVIEQNVVFGPGVTVETGARIRAFSHLEGCHVSRDAVIGPYARLRLGAEIAETAKIGNFTEIKNAQIGEGAKVNHLSYVGDADIGEKSNLGAGTITCNYDGVFKHRTEIGANAFVGSNTMLVAPVKIGDGAMTASGSVINEDVPDDALALGRARQVNKPGFAKKFFKKLIELKNKEG